MNIYKKILSVFSAILLVVFVFSSRASNTSASTTSYSFSGYAWSENIGWIDTSGLSVDSTGAISGYAWSENIGWISANSSEISGCPSGTCTASISNSGNVQGWLRAVSGKTCDPLTECGGWGGWISLSGTGYGPVL